MKKLIIFLFIGWHLAAPAQTMTEFKNALTTSGKAVQAIHHYPQNIQDGQCHMVKVTAIQLTNEEIILTETWSNYRGGSSTTTLKGKIVNQVAEGTWSSSFSSGKWSYDFQTGKGQWNKSGSVFGKFTGFQLLSFRIIDKSAIKDGFFDCP